VSRGLGDVYKRQVPTSNENYIVKMLSDLV